MIPQPSAEPSKRSSHIRELAVRPFHFARRRPLRAIVLVLGLAAFSGAIAFGITWLRFRHHLEHARIEVDRGHNAAASRHLARCGSLWFENREVLLLSSRVARRSGSWEEAEQLLDECLRRFGDDDSIAFERLLLNAARGDLETAGPRLVAHIERDHPDARAAREAIVVGLLYRFRWQEAHQNLEVWLAAMPDDTAAWVLRGKFLEQQGKTSEAIAAFRKVVELDSEHDEARLRLTTLLLQLRQTEELLAHLEHLRSRLPDHPQVWIQRVKALALAGRTEESRAALDECLSRFPDFAPALAERGVLAIQSGDDRSAEADLARAARLDPGDFTTRSQLAIVLARNGKAAEAERIRETLRKLEADQERIGQLIAGPLQSQPNDPAVPHEIATIALRSGQVAEAHRWLQAALSIDPNHGPTHQLLVNYYQASGNPALAAKHRALARQYYKKP